MVDIALLAFAVFAFAVGALNVFRPDLAFRLSYPFMLRDGSGFNRFGRRVQQIAGVLILLVGFWALSHAVPGLAYLRWRLLGP